MLALPGSSYLYQGEELGLPDHTTLPDDVRQDPTWTRSGHTRVGRDGCRVPLPWVAADGVEGSFGFSPRVKSEGAGVSADQAGQPSEPAHLPQPQPTPSKNPVFHPIQALKTLDLHLPVTKPSATGGCAP